MTLLERLKDGDVLLAEELAEAGVKHTTALVWIRKGILSHDGVRRRLKAKKIGGRWFVARGEIRRFLAALNPSAAEALAGA